MEIFKYQQNEIAFDFGNGQKMINASEMAKVFGKRPVDFLRLPSTKEYIVLLEKRLKAKVRKSHFGVQVVKTIRGGNNPQLRGTWMHEKLALKFAAWLSGEFELWVFDKIEELLTTGTTSLDGQKKYTMEYFDECIERAFEVQSFEVRKQLYKANQDKTVKRIKSRSKKPYAEFNKWRNKDLGIGTAKEEAKKTQVYCIENRIDYGRYKKFSKMQHIQIRSETDSVTHAAYDLVCVEDNKQKALEQAGDIAHVFNKAKMKTLFKGEEVGLFSEQNLLEEKRSKVLK